jgi:hypothetical protein
MRAFAERSPSSAIVAARAGDAHRDGFQQAGLADAVGAHDAGDLAGLGLQIDAVEDLRLPP